MVAAPLILLGKPLAPMLWALPATDARQRVTRLFHPSSHAHQVFSWLAYPPVAWILFVAALWLWHAPAPYDAALRSDWIHNVQHLTFFVTALLFWWPLVYPSGGRRQLPRIGGVVYLFAATLQNSFLGSLITFADSPLYPTYSEFPPLWGLTALDDQHIGGVVMWVGGGMMFVGAAAVVFATFVMDDERKQQARQRSVARNRAGDDERPDASLTDDNYSPRGASSGAK